MFWKLPNGEMYKVYTGSIARELCLGLEPRDIPG